MDAQANGAEASEEHLIEDDPRGRVDAGAAGAQARVQHEVGKVDVLVPCRELVSGKLVREGGCECSQQHKPSAFVPFVLVSRSSADSAPMGKSGVARSTPSRMASPPPPAAGKTSGRLRE